MNRAGGKRGWVTRGPQSLAPHVCRGKTVNSCLWCDHPILSRDSGGVCHDCGARLPVIVIPHVEPVVRFHNVDELPDEPSETDSG